MADNVVVARNTENAPKCPMCSQTVAFSHYNNLSAQLGIDPATGAMVEGGVKEQAAQAMRNIKAVVESIDHVMTDVVRLSVFLADIEDMDAVDEVVAGFFPTYVPAKTVVGVAALPMGAAVAIEALITNGEGTQPNEPQAGDLIKLTNATANAPQSALSTQTVAFSHYNNITAQTGIDPVTGRLVPGGVKEQTAQALKNIKAILASIDVPFDDIVKVTVFLKNLDDACAMNEVYKTFFPDSGIARAVNYLPARTIVPAAGLPGHALVQIEAVCSHGDGTPPQEIEARHGLIIEAANTDAAPAACTATQSVAFSHYNNISGQFGIDPATGEMAQGAKAQAAQALKNIKAIIESVDHSMDDIVKVNIFLADINDAAAVDEAYAEAFPGCIPARKVVGCGVLPKGAAVMIDAIAGNAEGTPPVC